MFLEEGSIVFFGGIILHWAGLYAYIVQYLIFQASSHQMPVATHYNLSIYIMYILLYILYNRLSILKMQYNTY